MAYAFPDLTSLEVLIDHSVGVEAALAVEDEGLEDLAPNWAAIILTLQAARDTRDQKRHAWIRTIARYLARDGRWDRTIARLSKAALHAADGKADQEPYAPLFGSLKAKEAQNLGPAKALAFGAHTVTKLDKLAHPALEGHADALRTANTHLDAAAVARTHAREEVLWQAVERTRLVASVNLLLARTEADILTRFPGDTDRVRTLLNPTRRESTERDVVAETETPSEP